MTVGDHQHQDDDADRPQRPGTDELREAEHEPERRRHAQPVVGADEEPRREDERRRREQHRERFGMEHRGGLHDDRAHGEEDDRREMKGLSSGPEQAHEDEEKQQRAHSGEGVDDLPDALGVVETEPVAELDS